jgi:hypothetical protein
MIIIIATFVLLILLYTIKSLILNKTHDKKLAFIVVLGDIGRFDYYYFKIISKLLSNDFPNN